MGAPSVERLQRLDEYLAMEAKRFHLPNVALAVVEGGEIVHVNVLGTGVSENSSFIIGSCSKTITALAALLALDEAGIALDTPLDEVFDNLVVARRFRSPTLRELLQHRSGLDRTSGFGKLPSLTEIEASGLALDLSSPPGEQFSYSNANYSLLGVVIEKVTGQTYCDFVEERIFKPAGMTDSFCDRVPPAAELSVEHQYLFGFPCPVGPTRTPPSQIPSGFLKCSVGDLARLQIGLMHDGVIDGNQVFPAPLIQQMKTPAAGAEFGYGMGLANGYLEPRGRIMAHEGATPTSYAFHGVLTDQQLGIVLLTNINLFDPFTDHGEKIYTNIFRVLDGEDPVTARPYRIWVRWLLIPMLLVNIWQFIALIVRWKRAGWTFVLPTAARRRLSLVLQLVLPIGIWYFVLRWVQVPFLEVLKLDPDIMWSFLFLTATGMVSGVIKTCAGAAVQSPRRATSSPT